MWTTLAGLVFSVVMALLSHGTYHDDGLTHYLYARWAWSWWPYLLDEWGRPGLTCLLFPAAALGLTASKVLMACVAAATVWMTYRVGVVLRLRSSGWVPLFCYVQPLFLHMSYGTMTETALAFYIAAALWLHLTDRPEWGACVMSLCFVTRYESLVLGAVWAVALWQVRASWVAYACLAWAPMLHNGLGLIYLDRLPLAFLVDSPQLAEYGAGTPLTMLTRAMAAFGPAVAVLAILGCVQSWRTRRGWIVPGVLGAYLLTHTAVYWLGTHGSGGYPRFLVGVSPLAALAAVHGLDRFGRGRLAGRRLAVTGLAVVVAVLWLATELESKAQDEAWIYLLSTARPVIRVIAAAVLLLAAWWLARLRHEVGRDGKGTAQWLLGVLAIGASLVPLAVFVRPHRLSPDAQDVQSAVQWAMDHGLADRPVIATSTWVSHFLDGRPNVVPPDSVGILDGARPGTVFVWDADYSRSERFGLTRERMDQLAGTWELRWASAPRHGESFARVYERRG